MTDDAYVRAGASNLPTHPVINLLTVKNFSGQPQYQHASGPFRSQPGDSVKMSVASEAVWKSKPFVGPSPPNINAAHLDPSGRYRNWSYPTPRYARSPLIVDCLLL